MTKPSKYAYDPTKQSLTDWLRMTKEVMEKEPKSRTAILKERARALRP